MVVGPCYASFSRWFFNKTSERCEQFIYGGCDGNANNFEGKKECRDYCVSRKRRVKKGITISLRSESVMLIQSVLDVLSCVQICASS